MEESPAACCARFYEQEHVQMFLGDSFHPGGLALSRRLVSGLQLPMGSRVLDVACGTGTSAVMMAQSLGAWVTGVDYSVKNIARAVQHAHQQRLGDQMEFVSGSADALPWPDCSFQALVCECAVSTFANKQHVASEFARTLLPGGVLCISDMAVEQPLPVTLMERVGRWTCVADALSSQGYMDLFGAHGLTLVEHVDERESLLGLISDLKRKLLLAGVGQVTGTLPGLSIDVRDTRDLLNQARSVVEGGALSYGRWVFSKGPPRFFAAPPIEKEQAGAAP